MNDPMTSRRVAAAGVHSRRARGIALSFLGCLLFSATAEAQDQPQLGAAWSRNMVSAAVDLPVQFDPETRENILWAAELGTETHATPIVAGGRILIGTNNGNPRDPRHQGDRGVLMCLEEASGKLLWQLVVPKRLEDSYFDWPNSGISSTATLDGDRAYVVDNRGVVLCLDLHGMSNGNDGPFRNEAVYYAPQPTNSLNQGAPAVFFPDGSLRSDAATANQQEPGPLDADIVWMFDLTSGAGIWSHDAAHSSILIHGNHLYLNTGTGVDNTHRRIRRPDAPSLVVLDKRTGKYLAREEEAIAPSIFHCTWAPPSMGRMDDKERIFFAAGNGVVYSFVPLAEESVSTTAGPQRLQKEWEFRFDPSAPREDVHRYNLNKREGPSNFYGAPVVDDRRLYVAGGGDLWWGKNAAWLKCIELRENVPVTIWEYPLERHTFSTAAVRDGLVFITDCSQNLHCVDAATGRGLWRHELRGETWASPLIADGKIYVGTRRGWFHILAASREERLIFEKDLKSPISATTVASDGRLLIATMNHLYAVGTRPR